MNSAIERLHRDGKTASEIFKFLRGSMIRSGVFQAFKRFNKLVVLNRWSGVTQKDREDK